jgi:predicted nucleic acid-binding protein
MTAGLLDTDLLLAYREGNDAAFAFVDEVRRVGKLQLSQASALALLAWCRDELARESVRSFLGPAVVHPVNAHMSRRAFELMSRLPCPSALTPLDGLVAATALMMKLPLYALDPVRYAGVPGLTALPAR